LIHLNPQLADHAPILADAAASFDPVELGTDDGAYRDSRLGDSMVVKRG
jgi:hypothetical protein